MAEFSEDCVYEDTSANASENLEGSVNLSSYT